MEINFTRFLDYPIRKPAHDYDNNIHLNLTYENNIDLNLTLALPYSTQKLADASTKPNDGFHEDQVKRCFTCGKSDPTTWRKGPDGPKTLCNACGLRYLRNKSRASKKPKKEKTLANETRELGSVDVVGRSKRIRKRTRKSFP